MTLKITIELTELELETLMIHACDGVGFDQQNPKATAAQRRAGISAHKKLEDAFRGQA